MFAYAKDFNHFVGGWTEKEGRTTTNMFLGATAFLAKYTSSSCGISAKPSECRVPLTDATFSSAIAGCLGEAPTTGKCTTYGASDGYGMMSDWDVSEVTDMSNAFKDKDTFNVRVQFYGKNRLRFVERERSVIGKHNNKESIRYKCELE